MGSTVAAAVVAASVGAAVVGSTGVAGTYVYVPTFHLLPDFSVR